MVADLRRSRADRVDRGALSVSAMTGAGIDELRTYWSRPMTRYQVTFFKEVCGDTGQDVDAPQGSFEVDAPDESAAASQAKEQFRQSRDVSDWTMHADRFLIEALPASRSPEPDGPDRRPADAGSPRHEPGPTP
jgi:hypothetical protein